MKAVTKILAVGVGFAALASAAPAAAQYYPGYGYGNGGGLGAIIEAILGAQRYGQQGYGYGYNPNQERYLVEQCARATESRIQRSYAGYNQGGYGGYGGYNQGYGYNQYASPARILAITSIQRRSNGIKIYGTATTGQVSSYGGYNQGGYGGYGGYNPGYNQGYGYNQAALADLTFDCTIDHRGRITDLDIDRNRNVYRRY